MWRQITEYKSKGIALTKSTSLDMRAQALDLLGAGQDSILDLLQDKRFSVLDLQLLLADIMAMRAEMILEEIVIVMNTQFDQDRTMVYNQVCQAYQKAVHVLKMVGGGMPYIRMVLRYAEVLSMGADIPGAIRGDGDQRARWRQIVSVLLEGEREAKRISTDNLACLGSPAVADPSSASVPPSAPVSPPPTAVPAQAAAVSPPPGAKGAAAAAAAAAAAVADAAAAAAQVDSPAALCAKTVPVSSRLLVDIQVRLSELYVLLAEQSDLYMAKDKAGARPKFPASQSRMKNPTAVEGFIDELLVSKSPPARSCPPGRLGPHPWGSWSMLQAAESNEEGLPPNGTVSRPALEVQALTWSQSAVDLCQWVPYDRGKAAALHALGHCMLYIHRKEVTASGMAMGDAGAAAAASGPGGKSQRSLSPGGSRPTGGAAAQTAAAPSAGAKNGSPAPSSGAPAATASGSVPLFAPVPREVLESFMGDGLTPQISQALRFLGAALEEALKAKDLALAQLCAEHLSGAFRLVSTAPQSPFATRAFEMLLLAQSCRAVTELRSLYMRAADQVGLELLLLRQMQLLESLCAKPQENSYWKSCDEAMAQISPMPKVLSLAARPWQILGSLPAGSSVLVIHQSATQPGSFMSGLYVKGPQDQGERALLRSTPLPGLPPALKQFAGLFKATESAMVNAQSLRRPQAEGSGAGAGLAGGSSSANLLSRQGSMMSIMRLSTRAPSLSGEDQSVLAYHLNGPFASGKIMLEQASALDLESSCPAARFPSGFPLCCPLTSPLPPCRRSGP